MFVSIYTISSCQSSSIPTYVGLSESLMVSFPDNLQLPCWRLYEIRQPPISLCTTSNLLMVAMVIMVASGHGHGGHAGHVGHGGRGEHDGNGSQDGTGRDGTGRDRQN